MASDRTQTRFRLGADLLRQLELEADRNHRSLNAEVVVRLERSLNGQQPADPPSSYGRAVALVAAWGREMGFAESGSFGALLGALRAGADNE